MKKFNKIVYFLFSVIASLILLMPVNVNAEGNSKSVELTLNKDYKNCEIKLTFSEAGDYEASITDGTDKNTYYFGKVDSTTMTCQIEKAKAGTWTVTVTGEGSVPKFTASMNGNADTTTSAVDDSISVGKDIVGLSVYFKDNYLVAEWADDTVGNVNVRVSNLDNSEQIAKETVSEKHFEVEIPATVKNITVGIVPSSSSSVTGAEQVFTFEVPSYPSDVNVEFPSAEYVNSTELTAKVNINATYSFLVEVNGTKTYESKDNGAGEYDVPVTLSMDSSNNVKLYVIDENGNMFSQTKDYIVDLTAPELSLAGDYDNLSTYADTVEFSGTIADYDTFVINDENIVPTSDGTWTYKATLHLGENTVNIKATDLAGNVTEYNFVVQMLEQKTDYTKIYVTIGFVLVIIIVAAIIFIKKNPRQPKQTKTKKVKASSKVQKPKTVKEKKEKEPVKLSVSKKKVIKLVIDYVLPVVAILYVFNFVLLAGMISSGSMEPTLMTGSVMFGNRLAYVKNDVQRGDIIFFKHENSVAGKRVIGITGDKIEFFDGDVYLNGEKLEEDYLAFDTDTNCSESFVVPEGKLFVMGDNRENSSDSRAWENPYVDPSDIVAKLIFVTPPWFANLYY
ncbi:MAG: signal peptidase I [Cellulosilyticum sp.]|nr:signal peptidase I [Cellulosilyticum sp.]